LLNKEGAPSDWYSLFGNLVISFCMKRTTMMAVLLLIMAGTVQAQSISDEIPESEFGISIGFGSQVMHDGNYNDMR